MGRLNIVEGRVERFLREPPSVREAAAVIVTATAAVVVGAGALIVTALIASTFVARATREAEAARAKDDLSDRELMEKRFDELARKLDDLAAKR